MTLTLTIANVDRLDNGESTRLVLDRHGAMIGRSTHADWSLPDPKNHVSSSHCEIEYRDGGYLLIDRSTNGTFLNGSTERLPAPHMLCDGDEISIGHYRVQASLAGAGKKAPAAPGAAAPGWGDWDTPRAAPDNAWNAPAAPAPPPAPAPSAWGSAPATPASPPSAWDTPAALPPSPPSGGGFGAPSAWPAATPAAPASSEPWAAPSAAAPAPAADPWGPQPAGRWGEEPEPDPWGGKPGSAISGRGAMAQRFAPPTVEAPAPSPWGEPAPTPVADPHPAAADHDVWGQIAATHNVDWARGGFGAGDWAEPTPASAPVAPTPQAAVGGGDAWAALLAGAGLESGKVRATPAEASRAAGALLKQLIAGLVVLLEARARAKAQLGAQSTVYERDGNNPLKWARTPAEALAQLLAPPERGFMPAERAVEDSFKDLQAHQMATLVAMQGALRQTLDRFSPAAIRQRAETRGVLAKIIPSAREAELWRAYEREFQGVVQGSDEAFMDVFSKAFKEAYEKASRGDGRS